MRARARVTLRVTNVSPRKGDSWLNMMPLQAYSTVGLAVVDRDPVGIEFGHPIRRPRVEGRLLRSAAFCCTRPYISDVDA